MDHSSVIIFDPDPLTSLLLVSVFEGRSGLAWLACGPHLEVVHAMTGERLSAYCFSSGGEHPPSVLAARDFSWLKRSDVFHCLSLCLSLMWTVISVDKLLTTSQTCDEWQLITIRITCFYVLIQQKLSSIYDTDCVEEVSNVNSVSVLFY